MFDIIKISKIGSVLIFKESFQDVKVQQSCFQSDKELLMGLFKKLLN